MVVHAALIQGPCSQHPEYVGHLPHPNVQLLPEVLVDAVMLLLVCEVLLGTTARPHRRHDPALEVLGVWEWLAPAGKSQSKPLPQAAMWADGCDHVEDAPCERHAAIFQSLAPPHHTREKKGGAWPCKQPVTITVCVTDCHKTVNNSQSLPDTSYTQTTFRQ